MDEQTRCALARLRVPWPRLPLNPLRRKAKKRCRFPAAALRGVELALTVPRPWAQRFRAGNHDKNGWVGRVRRHPQVRGRGAGGRGGPARRRGFGPHLTKLPGFRAYYAFVGEDGRPVSVSIVDGRAAAAVANKHTRQWVAVTMADLIPDPPEVPIGEMLVDAASFDADDEEEEQDGTSGAPWMDGGL